MVNGVTVHLIRHEKTPANVLRRYIGRTDESIMKVTARYTTLHPDVVYGSALKRCQETAALYFPNVKYIANEGFNELDFGDFEMKTYEELKTNQTYCAWLDNPLHVTPPNGESFPQFTARVLTCFQQIVNEQGNYTFVVHGGVIRVLLQHFTNQFASFQDAVAEHHTDYIMNWDSIEALKEGKRCTSYSAVYLMEKEHM